MQVQVKKKLSSEVPASGKARSRSMRERGPSRRRKRSMLTTRSPHLGRRSCQRERRCLRRFLCQSCLPSSRRCWAAERRQSRPPMRWLRGTCRREVTRGCPGAGSGSRSMRQRQRRPSRKNIGIDGLLEAVVRRLHRRQALVAQGPRQLTSTRRSRIFPHRRPVPMRDTQGHQMVSAARSEGAVAPFRLHLWRRPGELDRQLKPAKAPFLALGIVKPVAPP
mmetsp:Transcript_97109/g.279500  ORF Transcript_97109/g.279500 Transcript_97109/m.279500 type:complete len:221 (-) Transcript_97109:1541-2203(-)